MVAGVVVEGSEIAVVETAAGGLSPGQFPKAIHAVSLSSRSGMVADKDRRDRDSKEMRTEGWNRTMIGNSPKMKLEIGLRMEKEGQDFRRPHERREIRR